MLIEKKKAAAAVGNEHISPLIRMTMLLESLLSPSEKSDLDVGPKHLPLSFLHLPS